MFTPDNHIHSTSLPQYPDLILCDSECENESPECDLLSLNERGEYMTNEFGKNRTPRNKEEIDKSDCVSAE
jgi:hypothetical protein